MQSDRAVRAALARYDEPLLRAVAARLFKPRNQWPADELIDRAAETLTNPPVIDRRLKDLPPSARTLLTTIGLSGQNEWPVGQLLALLATLGHAEGLSPILTLLDGGLAIPVLSESIPLLRDWEGWLVRSRRARLIVPRVVAERAIREGTGLPQLPSKSFDAKVTHSADGLEWLLRMGVFWQQLRADAVRLTQASALFKPRSDPSAGRPAAGGAGRGSSRDASRRRCSGHGDGHRIGVVRRGERRTTGWAVSKELGRGIADHASRHVVRAPGRATLGSIVWLLLDRSGRALRHGRARCTVAARGSTGWSLDSSFRCSGLSDPRHPSWAGTLEHLEEAETWIEAMFLGWALPSRFVEVTQDGEGWWVRLSAIGRHLLAGGAAPDISNPFPRCLVVQPNGDVIAYRQGLTPGLIAKLSRFADWKMLGPACSLGLTAESVYRGLESGITLSDIVSVLQQNSGHPVPANVLDLIRRWAGKRERITVYTSATLLEFNTPAELEEAVVAWPSDAKTRGANGSGGGRGRLQALPAPRQSRLRSPAAEVRDLLTRRRDLHRGYLVRRSASRSGVIPTGGTSQQWRRGTKIPHHANDGSPASRAGNVSNRSRAMVSRPFGRADLVERSAPVRGRQQRRSTPPTCFKPALGSCDGWNLPVASHGRLAGRSPWAICSGGVGGECRRTREAIGGSGSGSRREM